MNSYHFTDINIYNDKRHRCHRYFESSRYNLLITHTYAFTLRPLGVRGWLLEPVCHCKKIELKGFTLSLSKSIQIFVKPKIYFRVIYWAQMAVSTSIDLSVSEQAKWLINYPPGSVFITLLLVHHLHRLIPHFLQCSLKKKVKKKKK